MKGFLKFRNFLLGVLKVGILLLFFIKWFYERIICYSFYEFIFNFYLKILKL